MVKERMDLLELLRKGGMDGDVDFLREALRVLVEGIMDAEVSGRIGAEYGERSPERVTQRNGYRSRAWDTRVGTMELHIPKLREGSYFPSLLEPRRRSERALLAVIQQAYVEGVSTRRVDDLVKALGCEGISKSQVSRICQELDVVVDGFLGRPLDGGPYPYLWLDALTQKVREDGRIVNVSVVVATAVNGEGKREIIGMDVGTSEDGAFWLAFLRSLSARGLGGVELVVSDAHQGLRGAIVSNARNYVPVEREIARNYRPLRQEVDHPGRRIGDHCCILDVRSSDGVQGGVESGDSRSGAALAVGHEPAADSNGYGAVSRDSPQVHRCGGGGGPVSVRPGVQPWELPSPAVSAQGGQALVAAERAGQADQDGRPSGAALPAIDLSAG